MLTSSIRRPARNAAGVTLVEMMVALAVGLIVVGAVLALLLSIMRSNQQTIQATRLTQELRATAELINNDLRRARGVDDPLSVAKLAAGNPFKDITVGASCVQYAYDGGVGGDFRSVRLAGGKVVIAANAAVANCGTAGVALTSDGVVIESLVFSAPGAPPADRVRQIDMTITGRLANPDPGVAAIRRTITQSIFIPSVGVGS
ncbi:hypothetical protein GCM10028862_05440 [Luteimonas pelagia]